MFKNKLKLLIPIVIVLLYFSVIEGRGFLITNAGDPKDNDNATHKDYVDTNFIKKNTNGNAMVINDKAIVVNNVAVLRKSNLAVGMSAITKGYYKPNDGGAGFYNVRAKTNSDTDNGGSIIILDNGNVSELVFPEVLTPSLFGAVCDGKTDDSIALQNCINYAAKKRKNVTIDKDIMINHTISVPSRVSIQGLLYNEKYPKVIVGPNCTKAFDCVGVQNGFKDIFIVNYQNVYRSYVGFDLHGNDSYNIDTQLINCVVCYAEYGAIVRGRNVKFIDGLFSHCKYGICYDFPKKAAGLRGCEINGTRFHGIGEEKALNFVDSAAIYVKNGREVNLTVLNCIADQGGTFICARANQSDMLITNNFVESFEGPLIDIDNPDNDRITRNCIITNNILKGKMGGTTYKVTAGYPDTLISIKNWGNIIFSNNALSYSKNKAVSLDAISKSIFDSNSFFNIAMNGTGIANKAAFELKNCSSITIKNNILTDTAQEKIMICKGDTNNPSKICLMGNMGFYNANNVNLTNRVLYHELYEGTFGTETTLTLADIPNGSFMIRGTDGESAWLCMKHNSYLAISPLMKKDATAVNYITYADNPSTGKLTFHLKRLSTSTNVISDVNEAYVIQIPY